MRDIDRNFPARAFPFKHFASGDIHDDNRERLIRHRFVNDNRHPVDSGIGIDLDVFRNHFRHGGREVQMPVQKVARDAKTGVEFVIQHDIRGEIK